MTRAVRAPSDGIAHIYGLGRGTRQGLVTGYDTAVYLHARAGTLWKTIEDAHESEINDVAACGPHDTFCTASADSLAYVWELETAELCGVCRGHSGGVSKVVWVEPHEAWVTACDDGTLRMWQHGLRQPLTLNPQPSTANTKPSAFVGMLPVSLPSFAAALARPPAQPRRWLLLQQLQQTCCCVTLACAVSTCVGKALFPKHRACHLQGLLLACSS